MFILRLFLRARLRREGHGRHGRRGGGGGWASIQRFPAVETHYSVLDPFLSCGTVGLLGHLAQFIGQRLSEFPKLPGALSME